MGFDPIPTVSVLREMEQAHNIVRGKPFLGQARHLARRRRCHSLPLAIQIADFNFRNL